MPDFEQYWNNRPYYLEPPVDKTLAEYWFELGGVEALKSKTHSGQTELVGCVPTSRTAWEYRTYNSHDDTVDYHIQPMTRRKH